MSILAQLLSFSKTMKRCQTSCGQNLSNEDKISQLPQALLLQILSLLATKNVVAMSVLSKLWRSLSKLVPNLKFICNGTNDFERFSDYVCRTLLSHQAPVLQSLHLQINCDDCSSLDIGMLTGIAFGLHARKLVLDVRSTKGLYRFPKSLFNCKTLETLKLKDNILVDVSFPVCLKSLRTLHLDARYKDEESVVNLLSGCSSLENLVVSSYEYGDEKTLTIAVPSLQRLKILNEGNQVYVINTPSLKYLEIEGFIDLGSCLIENTPELVEADINISGQIFMGSLTSVKRLSLSSPMLITYPTGSIFYQLVYLKLDIQIPDKWNLLTLMLDVSPKLQVLEVMGASNASHKKWNQPKNVPECLLLHLHTLVWRFYRGTTEAEKEVVKYILQNASRLKYATFYNVYSKRRLEILEELGSVVRASNSCQLVFKFEVLV